MIKLIRLGRIAANLPPRVLKPSQTPLATDLGLFQLPRQQLKL